MSTSDKITVIFGITIDSLALLTVLVYMPLVNWCKRKKENEFKKLWDSSYTFYPVDKKLKRLFTFKNNILKQQ